jgi:ABC-2 type transport system permease protein
MNTIIQEIGKVERPLQPVTAKGWQRGFANLFRKELGQWWSTRQWWIQTIIWVFILNGITTIIMVEESDFTQVQLLQEVVQVFLMLGAMATAIGIVTSTQSAIVGEKQLGTAAWIMSKPASRSAFVWAKWLAYALGFGVTAVLIPTIIFLIETRQLVAAPLSLGLFLQGVGLLLLSQLFYLSLTLMLGTLYNSRGPITGIGIALIIGGMFFKACCHRPLWPSRPGYWATSAALWLWVHLCHRNGVCRLCCQRCGWCCLWPLPSGASPAKNFRVDKQLIKSCRFC